MNARRYPRGPYRKTNPGRPMLDNPFTMRLRVEVMDWLRQISVERQKPVTVLVREIMEEAMEEDQRA